MNRITRTIVALFLIAISIYLFYYLRVVEFVFHTELIDFEEMTLKMNVKNIVTTIYLGPRIFDTFLEVMVVILTVFGMKFIRGREEVE